MSDPTEHNGAPAPPSKTRKTPPRPPALRKLAAAFARGGEKAKKLKDLSYAPPKEKSVNIFKAALIFSAVPAVLIMTAASTERISSGEGAAALVIAFAGAGLTALPALRDLRALREYVEHLCEDKEAEPPDMRMIGVVEDLPDSVRSLEQAYRERTRTIESTLRKNHAIFHALPAPVLVLSAERLVLEANTAAREVFRCELLGKKLEALIQDQRLHNACLRLQGYEEQTTQIEVRDGGKTRHYQCVLHPLTPKEIGEHSHRKRSYDKEAVICLLYDVSNIVKTNEAMRDFVANASHEIQTPLTGILGFIEAMLEEDFPRDSDYYEKFLNIAMDRARALSALTKDLLSLAKIEMSTGQIFEDSINMRHLAGEAADQYKFDSTLLNKHMELREDFVDDVPEFFGNITELRLMISNLLSNAVKYGAEETPVDFSLRVYENDEQVTQDILIKHADEDGFRYSDCFIRLTVRNYGEPIPPEKLPRLTERFYRVDSSRGDGVTGTGIGLSIVQRIVAHHDGILHITSDKENGTAFSVFFPVDVENDLVAAADNGAAEADDGATAGNTTA